MTLSPGGILLFFIIIALPAYLMNKFLLHKIRPRESFIRLIVFILLSVIFAIAYSALFIFIFTGIFNKN